MKNALCPFLFAAVLIPSLSCTQTSSPAPEDPQATAATSEPAPAAAPEKKPEPPAPPKVGATFAKAALTAKSGSKASGNVSFKRTKDGVEVTAQVAGVKPGPHGFHVHAVGDCSSDDAKSAGDHYNPSNQPHAAPTAAARHIGDLGNITINKKGEGKLNLKVKDAKDFPNWAEIVGKAVILHEGKDDLKSQPSGNAGARIACGVIEGAAG